MQLSSLSSLAKRGLGLIGLAIMGAAAVFFAMRAAPGDPTLTALGENATEANIALFREQWGLNDPLILQFGNWLSNAIRGNFGQSISIASGVDVSTLLIDRLPNTLFLGFYALVLAIVISLIMGTLAAVNRGKIVDTVATSIAVIGISMPDFWIGYMLIFLFALTWSWFPAFGFISPLDSLTQAFYSGFLPALAICAPMAAAFTRILRTSIIENLNRDHVRVARSLGYGERFIFVHHIFRNALIPFVTVIGLQARYLLGGTVVIERIFGVQGVGSLMVDAAFGRDYPVVQACALVFLLIVLFVNVIIDIICTFLNPRMR